jgi:2-dehydropantoate 2-reductase
VRAEQQRLRIGRSGHVRDQVPHLAADARAGIVELDLGAERAELAREPLRDAALALGKTVELNEREEIVAQAVRLDHARSMTYRARVAQRETGGPLVVAGAGALGSVFGGLLARAGFPVVLVGRAEHMAAVARGGLRIEGLFGTHTVRGIATLCDPAALDGPIGTVLLTVKSYDTAAMVRAVAPHLAPDGLLVSLQNGLGNVEQAEDLLGRARVVGARGIFGAELLAPGHVRVTVNAAPVLDGSPDPHDAARAAHARAGARRFADAGIPSDATDDLLGELWAKVFYNAALNPLGALLGVPYGWLPDDSDARALMDRVIDEAFAVARASHVRLRWPDADAYRADFYGALVPSTAAHRSSMLQDLERGRPTEIDAINGWVVRRGEALGVPVPANSTLTHLFRARVRRAASHEVPCNR